MDENVASLSSNFTGVDWLVLVGYLLFVSVLGVKLAGKQTSMEDFFRGGNRLPWYAVSGSMIATIISAVTFVGVPSVAYAETGNFTYLQFGILAGLLSRLFVAFVLVPAYYRHEVYSPYDYMGQRLGESARSVTTALFSVLGVLAQAARVYLTAIILQLVLEQQLETVSAVIGVSPLVLAIGLVGIIAVIWTTLGGITTVIWTDAMLFLVFVTGGLVALAVIASQVPQGLAGVVSEGWAAGKFKLWDMSVAADAGTTYSSSWAPILTKPYTIWAAIFAVTFGNIGAYGTDQLLAQRIFTCRSERDAKLAVITSWVAELVAALMLLVGVGLWVFYRTFPEKLVGQAAAAVADKPDNIFPVFILTQVPIGLRGLIVAGIFAAAISSLTSILAALSQTTLSAVYLPLKGIRTDQPMQEKENRQVLAVSRILIAVWGIVLCGMAVVIDRYVEMQSAQGNEILFLDLALGLANYIIGTLFAAFLLAWLPLGKDGYGLTWSAPLSVFCVVATRFHPRDVPLEGQGFSGPYLVCIVVSIILITTWIIAAVWPSRKDRRARLLLKTFWLALGCGLMLLICQRLWFAEIDPATGTFLQDEHGATVMRSVAWPWYAPIGGTFALIFGYLLGEPKQNDA